MKPVVTVTALPAGFVLDGDLTEWTSTHQPNDEYLALGFTQQAVPDEVSVVE